MRLLAQQILAHELTQSVEVLLVDDGNRTAIASHLQKHIRDRAHGFLHYLRLPERRGASAARNAGVLASKGELLVFLDDDVVPADDYICAVITAHQEHPEVLIINGNLLPLRNDLYSEFWFYYYNAVFNKPDEQYYPVEMVSAGHVSIKVRLLDLESPLFDTSLGSCEDLDLYLRLRGRSIPVYKDDRITALNECRSTLYGFFRQRLWWARGQEKVVTRYGMALLTATWKRVPINHKFLRLYLVGRLARHAIKCDNVIRRFVARVGGWRWLRAE